MDAKKLTKTDISDLSTADELANQVFRCSYHTFMTEIKILPDFPPAIGHPNRKGKLHWVRDEVIDWRNEHYRRAFMEQDFLSSFSQSLRLSGKGEVASSVAS